MVTITTGQALVIAKVLGALTELDGDAEHYLNPAEPQWTLGRVPLEYEGEVVGHFVPEDSWWNYESVEVS